MPIYELAVVKNGTDEVRLGCPKCQAVAFDAYGAQNKDELKYILLCSNTQCMRTLGEWLTLEEKMRDLSQFVKEHFA